MVFKLIFLAIYPLLEGYRDYLQFPFLNHSKTRHALGFTIRLLVTLMLIQNAYILGYAVYFWIVFNVSINLMTGKPWYYLDNSSLINSTINKVIK